MDFDHLLIYSRRVPPTLVRRARGQISPPTTRRHRSTAPDRLYVPNCSPIHRS